MTKRMDMIRKGIVSVIIFSAVMGIVAAGSGNEQPVAKATFSPQGCFACECKEMILDGSGSSDRDGWIVNYDWYYYDTDNNLKFIAKGKIVSLGKEFCNNPGTYKIKLVVTDNGGATDDYELEFIIKNNPVPMIKEIKIKSKAKDFYVMGDEISFSVVLENLGRGSSYGKLNYDWDYNPNIFQKIGNGGEVVFKVISSQVFQTNYKIAVVVSNACGKESQREEIELEVRSLKLSSSLKTEIILPEIYEGKTFRAESSYIPEQGDKITYLWKVSRILNGGETLLKSSLKEEPSFTLDDWGMYNITLEITNRYGAKGSSFETFEAKNRVNDPPIANASATQRQVLFGKEIILNGSLSWDPDGRDAIISYCWLDESYGENLGCSGNNPILKVTFNRSGEHKIKLTVKDNGLPKKNQNDFPKHLSDTDTVMINVIKSSSAVISQTPVPAISAQPKSAIPTPNQIHKYAPLNPQPPPPKESNKIPGMEGGMAIAVIITAVAFIKRRGK